MVSSKESGERETHSIWQSEIFIEGETYWEYGIKQSAMLDNNELTSVLIKGISTDREIVEQLIMRLNNEWIDPSILWDIVEDYLGEVLGL